MTEYKKIRHKFSLFVVWILFITFTLCGIITADARTTFNRTGKEPETVIFNYITF